MITKQHKPRTETAFDRLAKAGGIGAPDEAFDNPHHGHSDDEEFAEAVKVALDPEPAKPFMDGVTLDYGAAARGEAQPNIGHNTQGEPTVYGTREEWLMAFVRAATPEFKAQGYDVPDNIRVAIGFPSSGIRGKAIGECWTDTASEDGHFEIFVSPVLQAAKRIAGVLTHEIVHAVVGHDAKHGPKFRKCAVAMGLEGKMTATTEGEAWHAWADTIIQSLGPLPAAGLRADFRTTRKKQGTRLLKAACPVCELTFRITRKWYDEAMGELACPNSQVHMRVESGEDGDELPVHDGTLMICEGVEDEGEGE